MTGQGEAARTERFVEARDGFALHVALHGEPTDRPAILCLPGLTRSNADFEDVAPRLAADRLVVALSLRGRGRSGRDESGESYALDTYVDDVCRVLDELAIERAVLLGTSLGGLVALWVSYLAPERIAALVLNDIGPELQAEGLARIQSYAGKLPPVTSWAEAVAQTREVGEQAFPDFTDADWEHAARLRYVEDGDGTPVLDHDPAVAAGRLSETDPWLVFAAAADRPLLLVRGELTDLLSPATVAQMRAFAPAMQVAEVPGRGHAPTLEEPAAIEALDRFIAAIG